MNTDPVRETKEEFLWNPPHTSKFLDHSMSGSYGAVIRVGLPGIVK